MSHIHIVLVEPEIPQNTGNIARTCAATGATLHLVKPLGFTVDNAKLKRAGLDYWDKLDIRYYENLEEFLKLHENDPLFFFTTKAPRMYTEAVYPAECFLVFGKETAGLPEWLLQENGQNCVRSPMRESRAVSSRLWISSPRHQTSPYSASACSAMRTERATPAQNPALFASMTVLIFRCAPR